jgi:anthrone oxygenase-like protein
MVRALRWISLLATAVPLGATVAHVMELPNKLVLDGPLWLAVQQNLYRGWGPFIGPFEIVAIATTWALAYLVRARHPAFALTFVAALCLSAMLLAFFLFNAPVNAAFAGWTAETLPADWPDYRQQWELGHAIAFVLALIAFCTLLRAASSRHVRGELRSLGPRRRD